MASQRKPVIVRKFSRDWVAGYAGALFRPGLCLPLRFSTWLEKSSTIDWETVKWVCYVRDFPPPSRRNPERLLQKKFTVQATRFRALAAHDVDRWR